MKKILLSLLSIILFTSQAWAGWKIIIHQNEDGQQDIITYYITKNTVKISTSNFDFIYAKADRQIIILNHKTKS
jgi:hypothetical protein